MDRGDKVALLKSEARRRPIVADLLARVHTLTDEEIDNAPVPLKWYKEALRLARAREQYAVLLTETEAAMGPLEVLDTSANTKRGRRICYTGPGCYANNHRGASVEIKSQDWFFLPFDGGAWQNQTFFGDLPVEVLKSSYEMVSDETRHEYVLAWSAELPKRYGGNISIL